MKRRTIQSYAVIETEIGWLGAGFTTEGLALLTFPSSSHDGARASVATYEVPLPEVEANILREQLQRYFQGDPVTFSVPLDLGVGTPFQQRVWQQLVAIPYGETRTYAWLATAIGQPTAVRAVGAAVGANPIPFVVPCHRAIGSDGRLHGYAGGLDLKRRLLDLESKSGTRSSSVARAAQHQGL